MNTCMNYVYNKLRVVGLAWEVSHKSGAKHQRAAGAWLYIINKDVEEVQAVCCCGCYSHHHHSRAET